MNVMQSENINELAMALSKAQGEMSPALKDTNNPYFKSKYADLSSCWNACREVLSKNGLSVDQTGDEINGKFILVTRLSHSSGQFIKSHMPIIQDKPGIQAMGAAITYIRRYALCAIIGLCQDDDDANSATNRNSSKIEPVVALITQNQAQLLDIELKANPKYKANLLAYLKKTHGVSDLSSIPTHMFDGILNELRKQDESKEKAS